MLNSFCAINLVFSEPLLGWAVVWALHMAGHRRMESSGYFAVWCKVLVPPWLAEVIHARAWTKWHEYENWTVELPPVENVLPQLPEHWIPVFLVLAFHGFSKYSYHQPRKSVNPWTEGLTGLWCTVFDSLFCYCVNADCIFFFSSVLPSSLLIF